MPQIIVLAIAALIFAMASAYTYGPASALLALVALVIAIYVLWLFLSSALGNRPPRR